MNYFLTLTSTENSTFNFSYKLASPIILDENKDYECAVVDFICDDVSNIIDAGHIIYNEGNFTHIMKLSVANNESIISIVNKINNGIKLIDNKDGNIYSSKLNYSIESNAIKHELKNKTCSISYIGQINNILNTNESEVFNYGNNKMVYLNQSKMHSINGFYILSNIVKPEIFNSGLVKLFSIISLQRDSINKKIKKPIYKSISKKVIDEITIDMRENIDKPINFFQGKFKLIINIREK